ncbi:MAG: RdgB/HAM1 family non-canonical purine NTP pyrophosphatase [Candidatus Marinimicrobia bacterium]|nr:RdgB/HAM1 family non-canonical purine NTP pyrophosphatase [Candidatus Neomarinimicrobiota bacterium]
MKVLIATRNKNKVRELKQILELNGMESLSLDEWDKGNTIPEIEEVGNTLRENAFIKARTVFSLTGISTIADDTGLEVDALNGAPGIYSARYAGEGCSYEDNVNKLLENLEGVSADKRTARFRTVACFIDGKTELSCEGIVEGYISEAPRGSKGFGYDPIFYLPELGKTFAQLTEEEKNQISHRSKAMSNLIQCFPDKIISNFESPTDSLIFSKIPGNRN